MKRTGEVRLEDRLKVPPISFEFLWLKPLGGGEALERKRGDWGESTAASRPLRELHGRPLLRDAINLIRADRLICLLSEPIHCHPVAAIVLGWSLKDLDWPDGPGEYLLNMLCPFTLSACVW